MAKFELLNRPEILYRYRSLDTQERFDREIQALTKRELHFSVLKSMNDPMEGLSRRSLGFKKSDVDRASFDEIVRQKRTIGICSLSDTPNNEVMWAHYSGSYSGICIGYRTASLLDGLDNNCTLVRVQYEDQKPSLSGEDAKDISRSARKLLSFKNARWAYEREWRLLSDTTGLVNIEEPNCIASIRMGSKIRKQHQRAIEQLRAKLNKTRLYAMNVSSYATEWDEIKARVPPPE